MAPGIAAFRRSLTDEFGDAGCEGFLHVREIHGDREVSLGADEVVVAASTFKIAVALEFFSRAFEGRLDPSLPVDLAPGQRTGGPTGLSRFRDAATVSRRDLAELMLSISDNAATDALIAAVGLDAVNDRLRANGLEQTVVVSDLAAMLQGVADDVGRASWADIEERWPAPEELARCRALDPTHATRTTPREMTTLLANLWSDRAALAPACAEVRVLMTHQVGRARLAAGFADAAAVAAKSGSLFGVVRNDVGVVTYPDGGTYAAAVFTRAHAPYRNEPAINAAIGRTARGAVDWLRATHASS